MRLARRRRRFRYRRPWTYPKQAAFLFAPERLSLCEASTKAGKTSGCLIWLGEQAALRGAEGREFWWVAPIYRQAEIAFERAKRYIPRQFYEANEARHTITLLNGAVLRFLSGERPDGLYGDDVEAAVLDEASRLREAAYHAVRSTVTVTRAPIRMIGNVKGRRNWFYELCRKAEAGEPGMAYAKLTAFDAAEAGLIAPEEIEEARRQLPAHAFQELYLAEPADEAANPFGFQYINAALQLGLAPGPPVIWGVDLARSFNYTVLVGLNAEGRTCAFHRFQRPWLETLREIRRLVGQGYGVIDATGVGDPVTELLRRPPGAAELAMVPSLAQAPEGLSPLQAARAAKEAAEQEVHLAEAVATCPNLRPFKFTGASRQQLLEMYAAGLQSGEVGLYPGGSPEVVRLEHEAFEFAYTRDGGVRYAVPEGYHDDTVMAYALAYLGKRTLTLTRSAGGALVDF